MSTPAASPNRSRARLRHKGTAITESRVDARENVLMRSSRRQKEAPAFAQQGCYSRVKRERAGPVVDGGRGRFTSSVSAQPES